MDWKAYYRQTSPLPVNATLSDRLKQVGKTEFGQPVAASSLQLIEQQIVAALELERTSLRVVDLGCGNGIITRRIINHCQAMLAIDVSEQMVEEAERTTAGLPVEYWVSEIDPLPSGIQHPTITCGFSYEVWQHLSLEQAADCLRSVGHCFPALNRLFLGSLPDQDRIKNFYDTPERWGFYLAGLAAGEPHLGHWWTLETLEHVARPFGFAVHRIDQPDELYTSHYRFDALLIRE